MTYKIACVDFILMGQLSAYLIKVIIVHSDWPYNDLKSGLMKPSDTLVKHVIQLFCASENYRVSAGPESLNQP